MEKPSKPAWRKHLYEPQPPRHDAGEGQSPDAFYDAEEARRAKQDAALAAAQAAPSETEKPENDETA